MYNIDYHIVRDGAGSGIETITVFDHDPRNTSPIYQADSRHPHWHAIIEGAQNNDRSVLTLFDVKKGVFSKLQKLSDRISFNGDAILFDGDEQTGPLADHLLRVVTAGVGDYAPVVKFWEKVAQNPDARSREQLFTWLQSHDFTITPDGDILGYKGVIGKTESEFRSSHSGTAFVDGVQVTGRIPNKPGSVITMPRSKVTNNPNVHCHYGLHVGDWSYASTFVSGGTVLEVHVNPRDVVSIPNDASCHKMRCCRYTVVRVRNAQSKQPIEYEFTDEESYDDVGYDPCR